MNTVVFWQMEKKYYSITKGRRYLWKSICLKGNVTKKKTVWHTGILGTVGITGIFCRPVTFVDCAMKDGEKSC